MSITPCTPAALSQGEVQTWVNSQWKILALPGQVSAEINTHMIHRHDDGTEEWMAFFKDNEGRPLAIMAQVRI
jgi:hypothetical protein